MAAKVNTKFVMFLVLALCAAGVVVGGLYYMNVRHNADRNLRRGDDALARGDLKAAMDFYGRAVHKEPGNLGYLQKMEEVLLQLQPATMDEAQRLYSSRLGVLQHRARHDAANPDHHLALLDEIYNTAMRGGAGWDALKQPAQDMYDRVPESDVRRNLGIAYRSLSTFRRATVSSQEEMLQAEKEMEDVVKALPDNDVAWGISIYGSMIIQELMTREWGRSAEINNAQTEKVKSALVQAMKNVPNGPEVAKINFIYLTSEYQRDQSAATREQLVAAGEHLIDALEGSTLAGRVVESMRVMGIIPEFGMNLANELGRRFLAKHPDEHDVRMMVAQNCFRLQQLDECAALSKELLDAPTLRVSFLSRLQPEIRKTAASMLVDVATQHWVKAKPEDRPELAKGITAAREKLVSLVIDQANDPVLLIADARTAFSTGDYQRAAKIYDRLLRDPRYNQDLELLYYGAVSLQQIAQYGQAYEYILAGCKLDPQSVELLAVKLALELTIGRKRDAQATLAQLRQLGPLSERAQALAAAVENAGTQPEAETDPVRRALANAQSQLIQGEMESARSILVNALASNANNMMLLKGLTILEQRAGRLEEAKAYVAQALAIDPNDADLLRYRTWLSHDNPVDAMQALAAESIPDETERALTMVQSLRNIAYEQRLLAVRLKAMNDEVAANKAEEVAAKARTELTSWVGQAERLAPKNARLLHMMFDIAVDNKDWAQAEQIVLRAVEVDADMAQGAYFKGRLEMMRGLDAMQGRKHQEGQRHIAESIRHFEVATDRLRFSAPAWRTLAHAYQTQGNMSQAIRAYEQAYKCNPTDVEMVRAYLPLLLRQGDNERALNILRSSIELAPNDKQLRHTWLLVEADSGDKSLALNTRRKIYRDNPKDVVNATELAKMLSSAQPTRDTILDNAGNPLFTEQRWARMSAQEREQAGTKAKQEWARISDSIVDQLAKDTGETLETVTLRAYLLRERGEMRQGEQLLKDLIAKSGDAATAPMYIELARYQNRASRQREAVATLESALPRQSPELREVDQELGQLLMNFGDFARALPHLQAVLKVAPDRSMQLQEAECLTKLARFDEAEATLKSLAGDTGDDITLLMLQSSILEGRADELAKKGDSAGAQQRVGQARETLNRAQAMDLTNHKPRLLMAQSFIREYNRTNRASLLDDAMKILDEAEKLRSDSTEVSTLRVLILKERNDIQGAIGELVRFLSRVPDHTAVRVELARLYMETGQIDGAQGVIEDAIRRNPTLAIWHDVLGDLHKAIRNDPGQALIAYEKSYELLPTPQAMLKIADATLALPNPDCRALAARLLSKPEELDANPAMRETYARALNCANRRAEAIEQMRRAFQVRRDWMKEGRMAPADIAPWFSAMARIFAIPDRPNVVDASSVEQTALEICGTFGMFELRSMAQIFANSGDPTFSRAIALQNQAIAACPREDTKQLVQLYKELAAYYFASKQLDQIQALYEKILELDPNNVEALNNYAYLLADEFKQPAKAVQYADKLLAIAGENASVLDTVGWVHYLAGDLENAKKHLNASYRASRTPVVCVHLIEVLTKTGDLIEALDHVDQAKRMNLSAEMKQKVSEFEAEIRQRRGR